MTQPAAPDPLPPSQGDITLEQTTKGDRNQVIGQMLGGIVINQLTIHDRVPAAAVPPPISAAPSLTQQEYRQRQVLLNKVKEYWVKGVLETSLHTRALIELGLQNRADLVQRPFREVAELPEISGQPLPEGTSAVTTFDQMGAGRTLLILGEPGSGKTITLLKLAEDLIARTEKDLSQPIPVVFNLSSWAKKPQTIEQWLVQELLEKYQVFKALGKRWVETESLILLLDGLDEVKAEHRNACVQALNQFMQTHGIAELTICCRIRDYQALAERLMVRSAVCIQPLTADQIDNYFVQAGEQLSALKTVLHQDGELQKLVNSPLMLSIMTLAYQGRELTEVAQGGTAEDYRRRLFNVYIDRMLQRRGTTQQYPKQQTQHWLIWLAQAMTTGNQTVFLIEKIQPSWLKSKLERRFYVVSSILLGGLITKLSTSLYMLLTSLILLSIYNNLNPDIFTNWHLPLRVFFVSISLSGLIETLFISLWIGANQGDIKTVENFNWYWKKAKNYLLQALNGFSWLLPGLLGGFIGWNRSPSFGFFLGLVMLLAAGLSHWDIKKGQNLNWSWTLFGTEIASTIPVLLGGLIGWWLLDTTYFLDTPLKNIGIFLGSFLGVIVGVIYTGLSYSDLTVKVYPNQGIWKSSKNFLFSAIFIYILSLIGFELMSTALYAFSGANLSREALGWFLLNSAPIALRFGMIAAFIAGLINGGITCIRHIALRLMLYYKGYSPWNYAHFLNYATDRLFLQKVGGGYIFVHRMLMEHFAAMPLEQKQR